MKWRWSRVATSVSLSRSEIAMTEASTPPRKFRLMSAGGAAAPAMIQIAVLAWLFLGEQLTARGAAGLLLAAAGILIVQVSVPAQREEPS